MMEWYVLIICQTMIASNAVSKLVPVIEGDRIELSAPTEADSIQNNSLDSINWFNDTNPNTKNVLVQLPGPTNGRFSIDKSETTYGDLIIEPTERRDSGPYTCQIKHKDLRIWYVTYQLDVYYMDPPYLTGPFRDDNEHIIFYCEWSPIYPDKTPSVAWNRNGKQLNTSRNGYQQKEGELRGTLVILDPSEMDVGRYTCSITVSTVKGEMKQTSNLVEYKSNSYKPSPTITESQNQVYVEKVSHVVTAVPVVAAFIIVSILAFLIWWRNKIHPRKQTSQSQLPNFQPSDDYTEIDQPRNTERITDLPQISWVEDNIMYRNFPK